MRTLPRRSSRRTSPPWSTSGPPGAAPARPSVPWWRRLADQYHDKVKVAKINIDDNPKTAASYGVRSIPTLILFKEGKVLDTLIGLVPKDRLETFLKKAL